MAYEDGASLYNRALMYGVYAMFCKKVYVEEMSFQENYDSDRFFPELREEFEEVSSEEVSDTIVDKKTNMTTNVNMKFLTFENKYYLGTI